MSLRKNTIWNLIGSGLPLLAAVFCIPYLINHLGKESFGILTLIWAVIGYFSLFDMGVGRALTFELSKLNKENNLLQIASTLKAGLIITVATGFIGSLTMLAISPILASSWLKISTQYHHDATLAFSIAAIGVIPTTITSGLRGALEGLGRFPASNINKLIIGFCMFALPVLSIIIHGNSLWRITLYLVLTRLIVLGIATAQLKSYIFQSGNTSFELNVKPLLNYGVWVAVTGVVGPMMVYGDRFFVSALVGTAQLPFYSVPQEGLQRLLILPAALCGALLPQLSAAATNELKSIYKSNYKRVAKVMFVLCLFASILAFPVLSLWLSREFAEKSIEIVLILSIGIWLNSMAQVPYTLLHARGNPKVTAQFHILQLIIYIILIWFLAAKFGLIGAALAWVIRVALDLAMLQITANSLLNTYETNRN